MFFHAKYYFINLFFQSCTENSQESLHSYNIMNSIDHIGGAKYNILILKEGAKG